MGYTTDFKGKFEFDRCIDQFLYEKLMSLYDTRHHDPKDYNQTEEGKPGLYCQWIPLKDGSGLIWDQGEKFYNYVEWLQYIIDHYLKPNNYSIKPESIVYFRGEEFDDVGYLKVENDKVVQTYTMKSSKSYIPDIKPIEFSGNDHEQTDSDYDNNEDKVRSLCRHVRSNSVKIL